MWSGYWEANSVAHCCASMVSATEHFLFWIGEFLEWLLGLAAHDCNPVLNE